MLQDFSNAIALRSFILPAMFVDSARLGKRGEDMLNEALVAMPTVESFDEDDPAARRTIPKDF
jgi:hypothetical protein